MHGRPITGLFTVILVAGGILLTSCPSQPSCAEFEGTEYRFRLPVQITPNVDTIKVGTVVEVISQFTDSVYDEVANRTYSLQNYRFYPDLELTRIDVNPTVDGLLHAITNLDVHAEEWTLIEHSDGSSSLLFRFDYIDGMYKFRCTFQPTIPGVYYLSIASDVPRIDQHQDFPEKCRDRIVKPVFRMNLPEMENNYHLLENSGDARIMLIDKERFDRWGGYAFVVVE